LILVSASATASGRGYRQVGFEDLLLRDLVPGEQGPQPRGSRLRTLEPHLRLLDRQLVGAPLLGPWNRLEQGQRRFQPIARRGLLGQVGESHGLIELDDRLPLLDGLALLGH
jgi:hypothetical protein